MPRKSTRNIRTLSFTQLTIKFTFFISLTLSIEFQIAEVAMPGGCSIRAIWILNSLDAVVFSRYPLNPPYESAHMHSCQLTPKPFYLTLFCLENLYSEIRPSLPVIFLTYLIRRHLCKYRGGSSSRLVDLTFPCTLGFSFCSFLTDV